MIYGSFIVVTNFLIDVSVMAEDARFWFLFIVDLAHLPVR
jgi:hypothetical protein